MSVEPSMEEILSSIKRIIAEEEAPTGRRRAGRPVAPTQVPDEDGGEEEVLELSDPMPAYPQRVPVSPPAPVTAALTEEPEADVVSVPTFPEARVEPRAVSTSAAAAAPVAPTVDPILSPAAVDATRGALDSLSRLLVKPEPQSDGTLEGLVRDMLRPMLKEWLDTHLPDMVEAMVSREIARISGQGR